jgi:hypothetical protein
MAMAMAGLMAIHSAYARLTVRIPPIGIVRAAMESVKGLDSGAFGATSFGSCSRFGIGYGLDGHLKERGLKGFVGRLGLFVAGRAKRDEVRQGISSLISIVEQGDIAKGAKRLDVMYVKRFIQLGLIYAATLANVMIAFAGGAGLTLPIWAVISAITALPTWSKFAAHVLGSPRTTAFGIAIQTLIGACAVGLNLFRFAAIGALNSDELRDLMGIVRVPLSRATHRAKMAFVASGFRWTDVYSRTALGAWGNGFTGIEMRRVFRGLFGHPLALASSVAKDVGKAHLMGFSVKGLPAVRALARGHNKASCWSVASFA